MKNRYLIYLISLSVGIMSLNGCKKGDIGPQGEQGVPGDKGDTGDKGDKGDKGDTGTANVIYSDWASVTFTNSGGVYSGTIEAPKLTADVLNKGDVAVYEKFSIIFPTASTTYNKVPYSQGSNWVRVELSVGEITVKSNTNHSFSTFRYVLIPGGVQASAASNLDLTDYRAVRYFFGLGNN
ncbi:hypothetical protein [Parapedobacter sp. 10938]|uniref:hypothetical protein n=1 Tax=Parapedobacter flavus TaxID=3110225 RepID=UPI002DBDEEB6|nr:hypothetical protein [Parapedobacter sp. 10938]MEC3881259.1 hypothetical protein [Parapedobacter sp. 10938]